MDKIRLMTLFSGYDSQALAMERLKRHFPDFDYELVAWCENDEYPIKAHNALFPQWKDRNIGDITTVDIDSIPNCDIATWSYPCTDISTAGQQAGLEEGSGTRSSLGWCAIEIFRQKKPSVLVMENVKPLVSSRFMPSFQKMIDALTEIGYTSYFKVLNAKDYGVPQNRERVFMVSILDNSKKYYFFEGIELKERLRDRIEKNVDKSYWLRDDLVQRIPSSLRVDNLYKDESKILKIGNYTPSGHSACNVISENGISPTIMENHGSVCSFVSQVENIEDGNVILDGKPYIARKLTEREMFRLMDVDDEYIDKMQLAGIPKSKQYKLAGNSIVVNVLYYIFKSLYID